MLVGGIHSPFEINFRAIVGLKMPLKQVLHAVYYDGKTLFCGHEKSEVSNRRFPEFYSGVQYMIARKNDARKYETADIEMLIEADTNVFKTLSKTFQLK